MKPLAITLLSGGLDSAVATLLAREKCEIALALTFNYGQRAAIREIKAARTFCEHYKIAHEVICLPWLSAISNSALTDRKASLPKFTDSGLGKGDARAVWVPNRNAIFVSIASAYAEAKKCNFIIAGFNAEEAQTFPDNSADFVGASNKLLLSSTLSHPKLASPTLQMTKAEIARNAVRLELPPQFFWSCYEGGAKMCAHCESCARTIQAYKAIDGWNLVKGRF